MNKIYDNGALMVGDIQLIIMEIEKETKKNVDMGYTDQEDLLKELKELRNIDYDMVVCIDYDCPMGYRLTYWTTNDIVKELN